MTCCSVNRILARSSRGMPEREASPITHSVPFVGRALTTGAKIGSLWLLATAIGLVFQAAIAAKLGVSHLMDGYLVAITLPVTVSAVSNTALNYVIVPKLRPMVGSSKFWTHLSSLLLAYGFVAGAGVPIGWWLAPGLVRLAAPGLNDATAWVATQLLRFLIFGL